MSSYQDPADNPFNADVPGLRPETPALEHLLEYATVNAMLRVNKVLPARVVAKASDQRADIQLLPKTLYATDTTPIDKPVLSDVPVAMPMGAKWSIRVPFAIGDLGYALIADRSIENYLVSDGSQTYSPADLRLHDFADAIFIPGLCTNGQQTTEGKDNTDLVLTNGDAKVRLTQDGRVQVSNASNELLDLIDQLMTVLTTQFFTPTLMGPSPPLASTVQAIAQIQQKLSTLRPSS